MACVLPSGLTTKLNKLSPARYHRQLSGQPLDHVRVTVECGGRGVQKSDLPAVLFDHDDETLNSIDRRVDLGFAGSDHANNRSKDHRTSPQGPDLPDLSDIPGCLVLCENLL